MIEKMKMVHIVTTVSRKEEMLEGLRDMGLLHLAERKSADRASVERFATLSKTAGQLTEYAPKKQKRKETPILSDEAFETMYSGVLNALEKKVSLAQTIGQDTAEIERVQPWGEFSPESVKELRDLGFNLHFYRVEKAEWEQILEDEEIRAAGAGREDDHDRRDLHPAAGDPGQRIPAAGEGNSGAAAGNRRLPERNRKL